MGVRLFNRTTRSVALTEAGERFLGKVSPALKDISKAMEATNQSRASPGGTLRINTAEGGARGLLMPIVVEFHRRYPDVHVDIVSEGRFVDIIGEGFDVGIRLMETVPQGMIAIPLRPEERFFVVAAPDSFGRHGLSLGIRKTRRGDPARRAGTDDAAKYRSNA